jgi:uncharacterized membrane protein YadS
MNQPRGGWSDLYEKEDWWAIWLALGIITAALVFFFLGSSIKPIAVKPPKWDSLAAVGAHFADQWPWYVAQLLMWLAIFTASIKVMGHKVAEYIPGFLILFALSVVILVFSSWKYAKDYNLEAPLVALLLGLVAGNVFKIPRWLDTSLRTEYYIKTGIILLGATLPFTLIIKAGPVAFLQATIVSLSTFFTIYLIGTRMSISISLVTIWAIVMIFVLPIASKALRLDAGVAGAWIGTSEFADAAGFAAAQAIGDEKAIRAFTLMKVIGRDIWIGLWSFALAIISVVYWEKKDRSESQGRISAMEIWWRFPKFVLGFFIASIVISVVSVGYSGESFDEVLKPLLIGPIKTLRTWTFIFTFLCIGLTTRFRELAKFGWHPLAAFTAGVAVNVPLGFLLSSVVFAHYWTETLK